MWFISHHWFSGGRVSKLKLKLPFGTGEVEITSNYQKKLIAHKIWTELVTRKAALPFQEDSDVIVEVNDVFGRPLIEQPLILLLLERCVISASIHRRKFDDVRSITEIYMKYDWSRCADARKYYRGDSLGYVKMHTIDRISFTSITSREITIERCSFFDEGGGLKNSESDSVRCFNEFFDKMLTQHESASGLDVEFKAASNDLFLR